MFTLLDVALPEPNPVATIVPIIIIVVVVALIAFFIVRTIRKNSVGLSDDTEIEAESAPKDTAVAAEEEVKEEKDEKTE